MDCCRRRHHDSCEDECQSLRVQNLDAFCDLRFKHEFGHSSKINFQKTCHLDAGEARIHKLQAETEKVRELTAGELDVTGRSYLEGPVEADSTLLVKGASTLRGGATVGASAANADLTVFGSASVTGPVVGLGFIHAGRTRPAAGAITLKNVTLTAIPAYNFNSIKLDLTVSQAGQTSFRVQIPLPTNDARLRGVVGSTSLLREPDNTYLAVIQSSARVNDSLEADFVVLGTTPPAVGSTFSFTAFLVWEADAA